MSQHRDFSEHTYYVPFGRYQPGGNVGFPDNDVLVGREGQRSYFIDLLFRMGRQGAFLVTGHRGIGKTSFVKHCLSIHEEEVCERFLSSNVGRAFFWDQLAVLSIGFIVLLALEMTSQLIDLLIPPSAGGILSLDLLTWILLGPLVVVCFYPTLFVWEVLDTIRKNRDRARNASARPHRDAAEDTIVKAERLLLGKALLCFLFTLWLLRPFFWHLLPEFLSLEKLSPAGLEMLGTVWFFSWFLGIFHLEYKWIIRAFPRKPLGRISREPYRSLVGLTMPWILFKAWLPVLTIPVNLGFEKLDHRRVIHAMLAGLREQYKKAFLSWSSGFANLLRFLGTFILLVLVNLIGARWFELPEAPGVDPTVSPRDAVQEAPGLVNEEASALAGQERSGFSNEEVTGSAGEKVSEKPYEDVCLPFEREQIGPSVVNLICKIPGGNTLVKILYYDLAASEPQIGEDHLLFKLALPYRSREWPSGSSHPFLRKGFHFSIYHLVLLGLLYLAGRWFLRRFSILPYEEILRRIDEVMDFLAARTSVTSRTNRWEPVQVFQGWLLDERTRQIDQDPADPRTVEFLFLQILRDIQMTSLRLGGRRHQLISLPCPEVTFVFDELDKLGTRVEPGEKEAGGSSQQAEILHAERRRSLELHRLLADMKNLLSSAPARFIFVGGRNLHDEWLADQGSRQPLLTNIFNAEVYLPSLLTDLGRRDKAGRAMDLNIDLYLRIQRCRANAAFSAARNKEAQSFRSLQIEYPTAETFTSEEPRTPREVNNDDNVRFFEIQPVSQNQLEESADPAKNLMQFTFSRDFRQFLTYRSMGNPKRLKELLGGFIRPVERVFKDQPSGKPRGCEHVLTFGDTERFRIQLVGRIYRHLAQSFEQRLVSRDDKLAVSLFYLSDFLFKFHRRAFSWGNLERVDELVHIHRAPDLREILEALVGQWTERFLHPIRNGMYDFRFRSDLTREVEYISRQSPDEMAAFNFTLDESQALKSAYSTNIAYLKEKTGREPIDMVAGLGELHEFDQEYEDARVYYWRAIFLLDSRISEIAGELKFNESEGPEDGADSSAVFALFVGSKRGQRLTRHFLTWGISRLRLMLQIGMTFELTRNFERAGIEYRSANTLATALRRALLEDPMAIQPPSSESGDKTMHPLKHLNILFQPFFAEAWIAEKLASAVDTGIGLVEKELWALRGQLPFVKDLKSGPARSPINVKASNFSLIMAELHSKAGDLYFFKGRQRVTLKGLRRIVREPWAGHEGYLLRAHYHYAVALQEMRRLVSYRLESSCFKLGVWFKDGSKNKESLETENWPDFLYRSVGGALNDLAEATLGRVSLYGFLWNLPTDSGDDLDIPSVKEARGDLVSKLIQWMESPSGQGDFSFFLPCFTERQELHEWLGEWTSQTFVGPRSSYFPLIDFERTAYQDDFHRLMVALQLKMAGSKMLEKGGYIEGAAHDLLGVCEIVTHYLWWHLMLDKLLTWVGVDVANPDPFVQKLREKDGTIDLIRDIQRGSRPYYLVGIALYCLEKADRLFKLGRKAEEAGKKYLVGNQIPVAQLLLTCSLGLVVSHWKKPDDSLRDMITKLLDGWGLEVRGGKGEFLVNRVFLRKLLKQALVRHSYPMVNRLQGLKVLIDDTLLDDNDLDPDRESWEPWIDELIRLTGELDAPMHFTPLHSGVTYALAYCRGLIRDRRDRGDFDKIRSAAQRDLETSEEMFTLRRAYYENISDLSYLYDDFNDRQLHLSHGIQMAGAEINALFKYLVTVEGQNQSDEEREKERRNKSRRNLALVLFRLLRLAAILTRRR